MDENKHVKEDVGKEREKMQRSKKYTERELEMLVVYVGENKKVLFGALTNSNTKSNNCFNLTWRIWLSTIGNIGNLKDKGRLAWIN